MCPVGDESSDTTEGPGRDTVDESERPKEGLDDDGLEEERATDGVAAEGVAVVDHWVADGAQDE